jgi:hypothetical protein
MSSQALCTIVGIIIKYCFTARINGMEITILRAGYTGIIIRQEDKLIGCRKVIIN